MNIERECIENPNRINYNVQNISIGLRLVNNDAAADAELNMSIKLDFVIQFPRFVS